MLEPRPVDDTPARAGWYTNTAGSRIVEGVAPPTVEGIHLARHRQPDDVEALPTDTVSWVQGRCNYYGAGVNVTGVFDSTTETACTRVGKALNLPQHLVGTICPEFIDLLADTSETTEG